VQAKSAVPPMMNSGWVSIARTASFISRASILRPRYSGVRPTISPAMNTVMTTNKNMLVSPTPTPPKITFSHMPAMGSSPVSGLSESCMLSTEPLDVAVVLTAHSGPAVGPKRSSLPSRFMEASTGSPAKAAVGRDSNTAAAVTKLRSRTSITPNTTTAWRMRAVIRPNIHTVAIGISRMHTSSRTFVQKLGFSNGCVLFGPK